MRAMMRVLWILQPVAMAESFPGNDCEEPPENTRLPEPSRRVVDASLWNHVCLVEGPGGELALTGFPRRIGEDEFDRPLGVEGDPLAVSDDGKSALVRTNQGLAWFVGSERRDLPDGVGPVLGDTFVASRREDCLWVDELDAARCLLPGAVPLAASGDTLWVRVGEQELLIDLQGEVLWREDAPMRWDHAMLGADRVWTEQDGGRWELVWSFGDGRSGRLPLEQRPGQVRFVAPGWPDIDEHALVGDSLGVSGPPACTP